MKRYRSVHLDEDEQLLELQKEVDRVRKEQKAAEPIDDFDAEDLGDMKTVGEISGMEEVSTEE